MAAARASFRTYPNATVSTAPDFALGRAERRGHGGASICGGEDGGDLDGRSGHNGGEEAAGGGEKKSLEVGLEGLDEITVRGGGWVDAAGGVRPASIAASSGCMNRALLRSSAAARATMRTRSG